MFKIRVTAAGREPIDYGLTEHGSRITRAKTFETREAGEMFAAALRADFPATRYEVIEAST